jgi:hypothetical protein
MTADELIDKEPLTLKEAAAFTGLSKKKIPYYKPFGRKIYFKRSELETFLFSNRHATNQEISDMADELLNKNAKERRNMRLVREGWDCYSRRSNELDPLISCRAAAMIQALDMLSGTFPKGEHEQPEDNLRAFLKNKGFNPEAHYDPSKGVNLWVGRKITQFIGGQLKAELRGGGKIGISCFIKSYDESIPVLSAKGNAEKCGKCGENALKVREKCEPFNTL